MVTIKQFLQTYVKKNSPFLIITIAHTTNKYVYISNKTGVEMILLSSINIYIERERDVYICSNVNQVIMKIMQNYTKNPSCLCHAKYLFTDWQKLLN